MLASTVLLLAGLQGAAQSPAVPAATVEDPTAWTVLPDESVFSVITDKGGIAASRAHRHLVVATGYRAELTFDPEDPTATAFSFRVPVESLVIDHPEDKSRWGPRIAELGVTDDLGTVSEEDRRKIRQEMLDEDQLDPENHPDIVMQLLEVRPGDGAGSAPRLDSPWVADVAVSIAGHTAMRSVPVNVEEDGERMVFETLGEFTFEEFDIEPYSAFLGAVKVKNEFHIYVRMTAERTHP